MYLDLFVEVPKALEMLSPCYWIAFVIALAVLIIPKFFKKKDTLSLSYLAFPLVPFSIAAIWYAVTNELEEPMRFMAQMAMGIGTSYLVLAIITFFLGIPVYIVLRIKDFIKKEPYFDWDRIFELFMSSKFAFFYLTIILSAFLLYHFPQAVSSYLRG